MISTDRRRTIQRAASRSETFFGISATPAGPSKNYRYGEIWSLPCEAGLIWRVGSTWADI